MLYDVFISHASEDKESFVRPLAKALRSQNVEVWYDEFTLQLGDSIRRSLDRGLKQSRFGIVVLSHAFFEKNWPQYELDGLAEREMKGCDVVILPVWHGIAHEDVMDYSPSLAGRKSVSTDFGIQAVVKAILQTIRPQQSPLIIARDTVIEWGLKPPVITDEYWLEVVQASNRLPGFGATIPEESTWSRWSFPLPDRSNSSKKWGERLAWTALQMNWVNAAEALSITPLTHPNTVLDFIYSHPGLLETSEAYPLLLVEYAPQLTIPDMGGELESMFESFYNASIASYKEMRNTESSQSSSLTTNKLCPLCAEEWALRHPTFGDYASTHVANQYFSGGMFGPQVSPYCTFDHAVWLLSEASNWMPRNIHSYLLEGLTNWISWIWGPSLSGSDPGGNWSSNGSLIKRILHCLESKKHFTWSKEAKEDTLERIRLSSATLVLSDAPEELFRRFVDYKFPQKFILAEQGIRDRRSIRRGGSQ